MMQYRTIGKTGVRISEIGFGCGNTAAINAIEAALKRLNRGRIDVIQLHTRVTRERKAGKRFSLTPHEVLGPGGVVDGFKIMRDRGRIGYFGFSGLGDIQALHELVESGEFHAFQPYYNLLNPSAGQPVPNNFSALDYQLIIDRAAAVGMGAFVIRVLAAGVLTAAPVTDDQVSKEPMSPVSDYILDVQRAEKLQLALNVEGRDLAQVAIRFALMKPEVSTVLVGFSNKAHINEAVACSGAYGLSNEQMSELRRLWLTDFGHT